MKAPAHLVETIRWSSETKIEGVAMLSSGLGVAGPVLAAALMGHPTRGLVASLGALMVAGVGRKLSASAQLRDLGILLSAGLAAWIASALIMGRGLLTDTLVVLLGAAAAVLSSYSRPTAVLATRFIFALIVTVNLMDAARHRIGVVALMIVGALWTALLTLLLGAVARAVEAANPTTSLPNGVEQPRYSPNQLRTRWKRSLSELSGWQYALRLTIGLAIAESVASLWPGRHAQWIAVTVVLVTQRKLEPTSVRATQRVLGTVLGVIVASLLAICHLPLWSMTMLVALLGGVRPLIRARNYLLYSLVMTLLILLILDAGRAADFSVPFERLLATLVGAGLVLSTGMVVSQLTARQSIA
jgi:hypothetical protein